MAFVTSRNFVLPDTTEGLSSGTWFNMWSKKFWPYNELDSGDTLFWYESPNRRVVWRSQAVHVVRFTYQQKAEVADKLELSSIQAAQPYFVDAPDSGYCLSYRVQALERLDIPKPGGLSFSSTRLAAPWARDS